MRQIQYNIKNKHSDMHMLWYWVNCKLLATFYLHYYQDRYKTGSPYPNGRGVYPDFGFHIVEREL